MRELLAGISNNIPLAMFILIHSESSPDDVELLGGSETMLLKKLLEQEPSEGDCMTYKSN